MNKRLGILTLIPIFLSLFYISPIITHVKIPVAHASGIGVVCIADITQTSCPINPETVNTTITLTTNKATQFHVAVLVNGSASFNAFDIVLQTNPAFLKPANVSNNGLFATGTIDAECIGGKSFTGVPTCPLYDTASTIEFGAHGLFTSEPATGLVFTAVYNVTGTTPTTPISFLSGCGSATSVPPLCITINNGGAAPIRETSQAGSFSNSAYYSITTSAASIVVFQGATDTSTTVTLTSLNKFVGTVNLSTSTAGPSGIVTSLAPFTSLALKSNAQNNTGLVVTVPPSAPVGTNNLTITGTSNPLPNNSVTIKIVVPPPDFSISSTRGTLLRINATTATNTTIIFTSQGGFAGTVGLSRTVQQPPHPAVAGNIANLTATLNVTTVLLTSPGMAGALLTVTSPSGFYDYGDFFINITATSGTISHFIVVEVIVADFTMSASPTSLTMIQGTTNGNTVIFTQQPTAQDFFGQINVTTTAPSGSGITASCTPALINFTRGPSSSATTACSFRAVKAGTFTVTLTGTAKIQFSATPLSHSIAYSITVTGPDFSITALTTRFPGILPGSQPANTTTIQVSSIARFNGTLTLSLSPNATGPISTLSRYTVMVNYTHPNVNVILTIQTPSGTAPQSYGITVAATNGTLSTCCTRTVVVTLMVVDFGISASPTTVGPLLPSVPTNVNVTISPIHGYGASTVLTTIPSAGLTVSPSTKIVSKPGLVTLSVSSSILGTYSLTIVATNGPVSHNVTITVLVNARPDIAIGLVSTSPNTVTIGATVTFTIEVQNLGPIPENATVVALAGDLTVANKTIILQPYTNQNITLVWNTNGFSAGAYVVGAKVLQVPNESNIDNNLLRSSTAVTLNSASNTFILSQDQPIIVGLAVGLVAAVGVAVLLARRLTMKTKTQSS